MDTIFASATARGKAGISVVRLSGPSAHAAVATLCGKLPAAQRASLRKLCWQGEQIDEGLVLLFEQGHSFTGEAMAELHLHGSVAVLAAASRALLAQPGLRLAEPGEFTRRALENGRLDLTQVEGLADLVDAETEAQRRQALRVMSGDIGKRSELWRKQLIRAAALLEATIDFVDEDVPIDVMPEVTTIVAQLLAELRVEAKGAIIAERLRDGFEVAIVGLPNTGKSTLLNALAGREAAITSEFAGTTRDVIEVRMELSGLPVTLLDTAGIRQTDDAVENIGIQRAVSRAEAADLRVFLVDDGGLPGGVFPSSDDMVVRGKVDLEPTDASDLAVSGKTGQGITRLLTEISVKLEARVSGAATITRDRHRMAALNAIADLEMAEVEIAAGSHRTELAAENLRGAIRSLDALLGRVDVESLLDEIFSSFCIGK
jgi:tRNA modification GTPase